MEIFKSNNPVSNSSRPSLYKPSSGNRLTQKADEDLKKKLISDLKVKQKEWFSPAQNKERNQGSITPVHHQIEVSKPENVTRPTQKKILMVNKKVLENHQNKRKSLAMQGISPPSYPSAESTKESVSLKPGKISLQKAKKQLPDALRAKQKNLCPCPENSLAKHEFRQETPALEFPARDQPIDIKQEKTKKPSKERFKKLKTKLKAWKEKRSAKSNNKKIPAATPENANQALPVSKKEDIILILRDLNLHQKQERMDFLIETFKECLFKGDESLEGVFRVTGNQTKILDLASSLMSDYYRENFKELSIPELASVLKIFINSCQIFSEEPVKRSLAGFNSSQPTQKEEGMLKQALENMSSHKKQLLSRLLSLLKIISTEKKNETQMGPSNLAICIGPNFVPESKEANPLELLVETKKYTGVTERLISLYNQGEILN